MTNDTNYNDFIVKKISERMIIHVLSRFWKTACIFPQLICFGKKCIYSVLLFLINDKAIKNIIIKVNFFMVITLLRRNY